MGGGSAKGVRDRSKSKTRPPTWLGFTHVEHGKLGDDPTELLVKRVLRELDLAHVDWSCISTGTTLNY
jgi:hypothetical protein